MRRALAAGLMLLALPAVPAMAQERAPGDPVVLNYSIYSGGMHAVDMDVAVTLRPDAYHLTTRMSSVGLFGWLTSFKVEGMSDGTIAGERVTPVKHRSDSSFRGRARSVTIDYVDGVLGEVRITQAAGDEPREQVPRAELEGAVDPGSSMFEVARRVQAGGSCAGRQKVFDGRRRYDVAVVERWREDLKADDYNIYSGPALRCDFTYEPIAGFDNSIGSPSRRPPRRTGRVWFAEVIPGRLTVPVRIEVDGDVVNSLVHLTGEPHPDLRAKAKPR